MGNFENGPAFELPNSARIQRDIDRGDHVSCRVTNSLLKYLESISFDIDLLLSDFPYSKDFLTDPFNWIPYSVSRDIQNRASSLVCDERIMYKVGLATPKLNSTSGVEQMVRLIGNPKLVYESIPRYSSLFAKIARFEANIVDDGKAIISMSVVEGYPVSKNDCYYTQGLLAAIPTLWNLPAAEVHEKQCMCEGLDVEESGFIYRNTGRCVYEVTWQPMRSRRARLFDRLLMINRNKSIDVKRIEENIQLLDQKNEQLNMRNKQLAKVRELALHVDTSHTVNEVFETVVESARDIPGVRFVVVLKIDENQQEVHTPYYSKIRGENVIRALKSIGFDPDTQLGKNPTDRKLVFKVSDLKILPDFLSDPHMVIADRLSKVLEGAWPKLLCDSIQGILGLKQFVLIPLTVSGEYWGSMYFILEDHVPIDILEMAAVHCATGIQNVGTLEALRLSNEDLKASKELTERILDTTPNLVVVVRSDSTIQLANRNFCRIFNCSEDELMGKRLDGLLSQLRLDELLSKVLENKSPLSEKDIRIVVNNRPIILSPHLIPMNEDEILIVLNDVTDERERQTELLALDRLASIGQLVSGVAHEINNPLTGIVGFSDLLLQRDLPDDIKNDLKIINNEGQRAAEIVRNLLTFSRQGGQKEMTLTNVQACIQRVIELRSNAHRVNNIEVITRFAPDLPEILANPSQLQQVFVNIIINAEQAMLEAHQKGNLTITTELAGENVRVSIADDGPGISPEHMNRLFTPFFTTKEVGKGTGLGLSLSHGIIMGHNGKIYVESEPGKGATFFVEMPVGQKTDR